MTGTDGIDIHSLQSRRLLEEFESYEILLTSGIFIHRIFFIIFLHRITRRNRNILASRITHGI